MINRILVLGFSVMFCFGCSENHVGSKSDVSDPSEELIDKNLNDLKMGDLLVAFWNVENLFDIHDDPKTKDNDFLPDGKYEWSEEKYLRKLDKLSKVINDFGSSLPQLMGLVEVENRKVLEDLVSHDDMVKGNYKILHKDSKDQRGIDVALLYNKDYLSLMSYDFLDIDKFSENKLYSRDILYAKFSLSSGEVLHYFVNHWPSRRDGAKETEHKRIAAAKTLEEKVQSILNANSDAQILISGDFNDYPADKSLSSVLKAKSIKDKKALLVNLAYELDRKDKGTISYKGDWGMFDHFIVSRALLNKSDWQIQKSEMKIFDEEYLMYYNKTYKENQPSKYQGSKFYDGYSDHLAIYLELKQKK